MAETVGEAIRRRNRELAKVFRETADVAPRRKRKKKKVKEDLTPRGLASKSPEQIARTLNRQRIKSQSREVSRKRSNVAVAKNLAKRGVRRVRRFVEGKTKF